MRRRVVWAALGLALACQRGESTSTIARPVGTDLSTCPPTDENTFVLRYDARDGNVQPLETGRFPMGGQRIVLCVESPDFRDVYDVSTRREILGEEDAFEATTLELTQEISTASAERDLESHSSADEQPSESESERSAEDRRNITNVVEKVLDAMSFVEQVRWQVVRRLRDAYGEALDEEGFIAVRDDIRRLLRPVDTDEKCLAVAGQPGPGDEARCSFEQYVNRYELPNEVHIVGGEAFWHSNGALVPIERQASVPESVQRVIRHLLRLLREMDQLESFSESLVQATVRPRLVFDLGRFSEDRLVTITVVRHRRHIQIEDDTLKATWDRQVSVHQQEVHGFTYFRVEPGFAFSALRRPTYAVGPNDLGDEVIRVEDDGRRVFHPTVFASFYWCGVDVRASPIRRACPGVRNRGLARLIPFLPTFTLGIPLDDTLVSGQGNLFVGALFNWIPYVSIGIGAHLGFGVNQLRDGYRVGDPVSFSSTDLAAFTRGGTSVAPYLSITIAPDAFAALTDFKGD